ncbi:helix-turn-helix domain-containing protein [Dinghuibacter silviterrae]|uniref:Helix-turn-helix protein n=1 Tax=Dinghuibacter silviterrae TaxID=1539049 RepID=A0A4R8DJ68_9BACT|nr:helix-turn-helix transcriptional regulator [Dinghuibacter silviterrae]TDW97558.1 hypothetical protein EDB95_5408 [Dinghuibacter silviterrae]
MVRKPIKSETFISPVNHIPLPDAMRYVREKDSAVTEDELAEKLGIPGELFRAYLSGEELPPDDLAPKLLSAYNLGIVRGTSIVTYQPMSVPPEPPE